MPRRYTKATRRIKHRKTPYKKRTTHSHKVRKQRGGSILNAPNGSIVTVRLEKGDDYQPFVQLFKEDAEREDL
jgi:hypothetical protein